jgi:hypothetical protein
MTVTLSINLPADAGLLPVPPAVVNAGDRAAHHFLEFFTAQIRNPHTRCAYARAVGDFCGCLKDRQLPSITAVTLVHIAA